MHAMPTVLAIAITLLAAPASVSGPAPGPEHALPPSPESSKIAAGSLAAKPEAIEAWKDMRFGMFICWGRSKLELEGTSPGVTTTP
jgi:hypothetical protein